MAETAADKPVERAVKKLSKATELSGIGRLKSKRAQEALKKLNADTREAWTELFTEKLFQPESEGAIEPEFAHEKTYHLTQQDIKQDIDLDTSSKLLNFELEHGPFVLDVTDDGQYMVLASRIGEVSMLELRTNRLVFEKSLMQYTRQVKCLFNEQFWAAVGKKYVSIYDKNAVEIHCFKNELDTRYIDFLPYHAMLASWTVSNRLVYRDLTSGAIVGTKKTRGARETNVMRQNPYSGVMFLGDSAGNVNLYLPSAPSAVMTFHAHPSVTALACLDRYYCATAGLDNCWKVYDIRKAQAPVARISTGGLAPRAMEASATGILALSTGQMVTMWKDVHKLGEANSTPYLRNPSRPGSLVNTMKFRPFEDLLYLGLSSGLQSLLVPGAGLSNVDSRWNNPYSSKTQRSTELINRLLEKLPPESIRLGFSPPSDLIKVYPKRV